MLEIGGCHIDEDWAELLEADFTHFMDKLLLSTDGYEVDAETETDEPFCGCDTCLYREALAFLVPKVIAATESGLCHVIR